MPDTTERGALRTRMRAERRRLDATATDTAGRDLLRTLGGFPAFVDAGHLAGYLPMPGEMDTRACLRHALARGKTCYVPVLLDNALLFAPWTPDTPLLRNRFGLDEPQVPRARMRTPMALDLVLVPLVAFDEHCNRLGMGGGYYDRSFADRLRRAPPPWLVGVAHDLQKTTQLAAEAWDVPLDAVATASHLYHRHPGS